MSDFKLKSKQDIEDFLTGCAFFGTGGGGDVKTGRASLNDCLEQGLEMTVLDPEEVRDDGYYCAPCFIGSMTPMTPELRAEMEFNGYTQRKYGADDMLIGAVRRVEAYTGKQMDGLTVVEMGGSNTACCMAAAYKMGLPVIDGDAAGRAVPEASNTMYAIHKAETLPSVYLDPWGNSVVVTEGSHMKALERISKYVSEAAYGGLAAASCPRSGALMKKVLVRNTLSRALKVGRAINAAKADGDDLLEAAARASGGLGVGRGVICNVELGDIQGYYTGTYTIRGSHEFEGREYKIWFKNENHVLWVDGVVHTTSPDLISLIDLATGAPLLNTYLKAGLSVGIVISPSSEQYRSPAAIAAFGPRFFGFDFDYVPYGSVVI